MDEVQSLVMEEGGTGIPLARELRCDNTVVGGANAENPHACRGSKVKVFFPMRELIVEKVFDCCSI